MNGNIDNAPLFVRLPDFPQSVLSSIFVIAWNGSTEIVSAYSATTAVCRPLHLRLSIVVYSEKITTTYRYSSAVDPVVVVILREAWKVPPHRTSIWGIQYHSVAESAVDKRRNCD